MRDDLDAVPALDARDPNPEPCPLPLTPNTLLVALVIVAATVLVSCIRPWGFV